MKHARRHFSTQKATTVLLVAAVLLVALFGGWYALNRQRVNDLQAEVTRLQVPQGCRLTHHSSITGEFTPLTEISARYYSCPHATQSLNTVRAQYMHSGFMPAIGQPDMLTKRQNGYFDKIVLNAVGYDGSPAVLRSIRAYASYGSF